MSGVREELRGGLTCAEIGAILGISRERVRQIERDALAKLRAMLEAEEREAERRVRGARR